MKRIINKHDVFISWTGADREFKNTVADFLRNNGISCLESDHSCSGDFRQWSQEAVSRCNIFLLIGSVNVFNSEWVPVEIEEYKKLDNSKNRIIPVWVSRDAWEREPWGIKEYASAVLLNEDGLTEDALKDVLSKVKLLLIDFLDREYKEASKSEYIKLISLSRKSKTVDRDFDFSTLYINRTLCETDDKGTELKKYSSTDFLYESDSVCFICGPAGCGKSQYINQIREGAPKNVVIIRLPCSGVSSAADVFSEAYKEFSRVCGNRFFYSEDDFASLLNSRKVVLIFDGMDEIATVEDKRRLIAKAEIFCKANQNNVTPVFISRNTADAALIAVDGKNVRRFKLKKLSENETETLSNNLFICFKKEDKADDFFFKAKDLDDEIRSNPLLLSQLAIIYDCNNDIPHTVVGIYDAITEITLKLDKNADMVIPDSYRSIITDDISAILKSFAKTKYTLASKGRSFDTERILNIVLEAMNYKGDLQQMSEFLVDYLENRALFVDGEFYHKMFLEYFTAVSYYEAAFYSSNTIKDEAVLRELFSHYDDPYWSAVIKMLLIKADSNADEISTKELYKFISQLGICEYTLLFDTCRDLIRFKEEAQTVLAADIIRKSDGGVYPAYGPLFWYIPEYGLYKACLTALISLKNEADFAKMLALVRDVCFIFSGKYTAEAFTDKSACIELFNAAKGKLSGVRKALCELFYLGNTDFTGGDDIYPRCFNVSEAASFMENGCGVIGRMSTPFEDELGLFEHTAYNELCGEFIGVVSCPYVIDEIENVLTKKSCRKLSCLILSPSDNTEMQYIAINQNHVRAVYVPENVETMRNKAIHISFSITILSEGLFYFSSDFTLPNGVTKILKEEFSGYSSIKSVVFSEDVTEICEHAFSCCFNLEKIYISKSVTRIAEGAFWGTKLTSINIPNSITSIAKDAFWGSSKLTRFSVDTDNLYYSSDACGVLFDKAKSTLLQYPDNNKAKKYSLPDSVTYISDSAFSRCENLTDIIIPNSVISIGDKAFLGCTSLTNIAIPNSVTGIGAEAFSGCTSLTNIAIPNSVTGIGAEAFSGCTSLTNIAIPNSVTSIGKWAFSYCENLTDIIIPNSVTSVGDKAFENCTKLSSVIINSFVNIEANIFEGCCNLKDIVTPNGVVNIAKAGTLGNKLLSNITISNNITAIDSDTFKSYTKIKSIIIPDSIATIADYTFQTCNNLTKIVVDVNNPYYSSDEYGVLFNKDKTKLIQYPIGNPRECYTIPDGVTHISACAFKHCENLTNISIPNSVTTIGGFDSCTILQVPNRLVIKGIDVFSHCKKLVSINIPDSVIYISAFSFDGCTNLKSVKISNSVKRIDACTFRQCTNLKNIIIPNIVTDIRKNAFENCCSLEEIEIPSSVRIIGNDAFNGCTGLMRVVISRRFEDDIERIFGNINRNIISFAD